MSKKIERASMTQTDSKGRVIRAPRDNATGEAANFRWWTLEESEMANAICATVSFIERAQSKRLKQLVTSTWLYGSSNSYNTLGMKKATSGSPNPSNQSLGFNIIQSVVDTLTSKMAKNKVVPTYITNGGIWDIQKKAEQLTKFTQGLFYQLNAHDLIINAFRDSAVWGDGFLHVFEKHGKVTIERVLPHEIYVDVIESAVTKPTQLHRVKYIDRDIACELFPELNETIQTTSPASYLQIGSLDTAADLVQVIESWHLKSSPDANDGCHAITIGDQSLVDSYEKEYFPFPHFWYSKDMHGWYGQGAAERLQRIQNEINRDMITIQRSIWQMGTFKIAIPYGNKSVPQHFNNDIGSIWYYDGSMPPPQYLIPPAVQPEIYSWVDSLIMKGYQQEGVSQLSAAAIKPLGVDSGKAMRTMTNIEDDRFLFMQQQIEQFALEVARQSVNVVKDIYKDKKTYEVIFPDTRFMETVDWKDINLDEEEYTLKAYPTSSLSEDLTGRLEEIQELTQAGMISPRASRKLMDMPDVEMSDALANAAEDRIHQIFEKMLHDGENTVFEAAYHDANLAQQLGLQYINYAELNNAPEDRIALIENYLDQVHAQVLSPTPGIVPQPQAAPEAMPTSNLIPNVPGQAAAMGGAA